MKRHSFLLLVFYTAFVYTALKIVLVFTLVHLLLYTGTLAIIENKIVFWPIAFVLWVLIHYLTYLVTKKHWSGHFEHI